MCRSMACGRSRTEREKGTAGQLVLPPLAVDIIRAQPHIGDNAFVFVGRGNGHYNGHSKGKNVFNSKLPAMPQVASCTT